MSENYDPRFFAKIDTLARVSAERVVPLLLTHLAPSSVIDVGCGTGTWLSIFARHGIIDLFGIDGSWVKASQLQIPHDRFQAMDLSKPFELSRRFDLAICLEVAEHLPSTAAEGLVVSLQRLAKVVLFSAAIPGQGGVDHLNEQWPDYWAELFARHGFVWSDAIRDWTWNDPSIAWFYRQNMILFFAEPEHRSAIEAELPSLTLPSRRVHPELLAHLRAKLVDPGQLTLRDLFTMARWNLSQRVRNVVQRKRQL